MSDGTDSDELVVCSRVRAGHKREFAFALKVQAEISGSLGRTRTRKAQNGAVEDHEVSGDLGNKRLKGERPKEGSVPTEEGHGFVEARITSDPEEASADGDLDCLSEEEPKSDVVDLTSDDEPRSQISESASKEAHAGDVAARPICDVVEIVSDDDPKSNMIDHGSESKSEMFSINKEAMDDDAKTANVEEESAAEVGEAVAKPWKFYTRSLLRFKAGPKKVPKKVEGGAGDVENQNIIQAKGDEVKSSSECRYDDKDKANGQCSPFLTASVKKLGVNNIPKNLKLEKRPTMLRELLATGLLEGLTVKYIRGPRSRAHMETGLLGLITGIGILCYCSACKGKKVVTPNQFELHAGSSNKRPPEYTYLENGNTLRDVLNACKSVPLNALAAAVNNAIGCSSIVKSSACWNDKESVPEDAGINLAISPGECLGMKESQGTTSPVTAHSSDGSHMPNLSSKKPKVASKSNVSCGKSQGRITRKDLGLHKLVFEEDVLPDGTEVAYYSRGQKLLVGFKQGFGILCTCCNSEVSPSQFEAHAGWASRRKPYLHIYTSNGVSLHELSVSLSRGRKFSAIDNDDLCSICADGGDLLCCDGCPRAFHKECISLSSTPGDPWYCRYCETKFQQERILEHNANAVAAGRIAGIDPMEQINQRCIRIAKTSGPYIGGCVLCRGHDFSKRFGPRTVILCDQCEKEYHVGCLKKHNMDDLQALPEGQWFCCTECARIHSALQKFVSHGEESLPDNLLNVIKKKHDEKDPVTSGSIDIKLRVLRGKNASDKTRPLLSKAVAIFHERFDPILDLESNRDFITHMVFGRNMKDKEFGNMYCALLTVNSFVVCAGLFRVLGQEVAELPLVATLKDFQGLGYFQCLFSCIERLLGSLNVRKLVLPAAEEAESIWTKKFGFSQLTQEEWTMYKDDYSTMMTFDGTAMLQKPVPSVQEQKKSEVDRCLEKGEG